MTGKLEETPDLFAVVDGFVTASLYDAVTDCQFAEFESLLRNSGEVRRMYADCIELAVNLPRMAATFDAGDDGGDVLVEPPVPQFPGGGAASPASSPAAGLFGDLLRWGENLPGMRMFVWLLAGFVGMLVGLPVILALLAALGLSSRPATPPAAVAPAAFVARLAAADCQWVDPESALGEGALLIPGQKLELASGRVDIVFQSGAKVKLHGPTIFEIRSANSGFLTIGRLTARADTPESHGFTVHSRTAATVDLGTEFNVVASEDGHSQIGVVEGAVEVQLANGSQRRRLGVGQSIEVEPGIRSVIARIEPGENTPAFKFPTIEPPSADDYADASQGHAHISILRGRLHRGSGPPEVLLDGKGQSKADSPGESLYFDDNNASGLILLDLGEKTPVKKVNTYSWHQSWELPEKHVRATQRYYLYGASGATPPDAEGNLAAAGWTLIAEVNTDEFFGFPHWAARPAQQAVSITAADGGPIGEYRYLLWDVRPTRSEVASHNFDNTFYGEFDIYAMGKNAVEENAVGKK